MDEIGVMIHENNSGKTRVIKKTINAIPDIAEKIKSQVDKFVARYGEHPQALLLGPVEYLSLVVAVLREKPQHEVEELEKEVQKNGGIQGPILTTFLGYQVIPKSFPGVDLALGHNLIGLFAVGRVEAQDTAN